MKPVPVKFEVFELAGGLDLVTPIQSLKPGIARDALNWEASVTGGYSRIAGYERTQGQLLPPSAATYLSLTVNALHTSVSVGDTISNGAGATGTVIAIQGNAIFYTQAVGAFAIGDVLTVGPIVTAISFAVDSPTSSLYNLLAANVYRALINPVPGSGPSRGVAYFGGVLYGWRDSVGATALGMYKATLSGWVQITFGYEVAYSAGSGVPPAPGVVITKGSVSSTVRAVTVESGTWAGNNAAGRFIVDTPTGGAFTAGALIGGATANLAANLKGNLVQAAISFLPGGRIQTVPGNFGGVQSNKLYGCDNVNRGWEFDGTTMVPIDTGMTTDIPTNVIVHKNYLFFSFGPSLQFSAVGFPYDWEVILGAGELVMNDDITGLVILPGDQSTGALAVFTRTNTSILYGTSFGNSGNAQLVPYNTGFGSEKYTAQNMEQTYALAARGVVGMNATQAFGNFDADTLTLQVRPYIQQRRGTAVASGLNREKSQYRVFYADGSALYMTITRGEYTYSPPAVMASMPVTFPHPVTCWCEGPDNTEIEQAFFGSTDGYIRQMDSGPNFDGIGVEHRFTLNFDSMTNPRILKRYRKAALEVSAQKYLQFTAGYTLAYDDTKAKDQPLYVPLEGTLQIQQWDGGFTWDSTLVWDGRTLGPVEMELVGSGENIALAVNGNNAAYGPFTINTITIHFTPRRGLR